MRILLVTVAAVLATAAPAAAKTVDVLDTVGGKLPSAEKTDMPTLLPSKINLDYDGKVYTSVNARKGEYGISFAGAPDCGGANACFLALFTANRGQPLGFKKNVTLANGIKGAYKPLSCGGSCSPPSIEWIQKGVHYEIQAKALGGKKHFVSMANSAIRHGHRT
jgi:hypothetical protein